MRISTFLLLVSFLLAPSVWAGPEGRSDGPYVVLTGFGSGDPYQKAALRLAKHKQTKHVMRFDPDEPAQILDTLREIEPQYVAFVLRPEQIHVNSVRRILKMSASIDPDPFVDFDYGFITGATAAEATQFVENIIKAETAERSGRLGRAAVWGGTGASTATDGRFVSGRLEFPIHELRFRSPEGEEHGRDQAFLDEHLSSLEGSGAIIMGGHGMPWEIGSGPRAEDMAKLDLFPAVAFNYACHTGVTHLYPDRQWDGSGFVQHLREVEQKRSFALAMIRNGITGYVAYVNPRPAGPELSIDFARMLAGATLGAVRRNDYNKVVLGYLGWGETGIVVGDVVEGERKSRADVDPVRHMMLDGATGGILYGDPAARPYPVKDDVLPLRVVSQEKDGALHVTVTIEGQYAYLWGADPFRRFGESMAMKAYGRVPLPKDMDEIQSVEIVSAIMGGSRVETLDPVWALETDRGQRFLHAKANFARGKSGDVVVKFVARTSRAPVTPTDPEPTKADGDAPKRWLDHAKEVGALVVERAPSMESHDVYSGGAGAALFLLNLHAVTKEPKWLDAAKALLERAKVDEEGGGLYTGAAGIGQVCLDGWRLTKDRSLLERAKAYAEQIGEPEATDVISGAAGCGIFLLNLHAATGDARYLKLADTMGAYLAEHALNVAGLEPEHVQTSWPITPGSDRTYVGFSHGAAGNGYFLLQLAEATGNKDYAALARGAAEFVMQTATPDGKGGWKWTKMSPARRPDDFRVQWCHGSPGIGLFFLALTQAFEKSGSGPYAEALWRCVSADLRDGRTARNSGCQCHGVAGNAELFIEVFRQDKNPSLLAVAERFGEDLVDENGVKTAAMGHAYEPGYMTGLAGIGQFLLRLASPEDIALPFMVDRAAYAEARAR